MHADVLARGDLVQTDAFDEVRGGVDERDGDVGALAPGDVVGAAGGRESGVAGPEDEQSVGHGNPGPFRVAAAFMDAFATEDEAGRAVRDTALA